jgi:hypothetical protein
MAMLPESRREDRCRQAAEMKGIEIAHRGKSDLILPPLARPNTSTDCRRFQLHFRFQLGQR